MEFILSLLQGNTYDYVFSLVLASFFIYTMTKIIKENFRKTVRWTRGSRMKVKNINQIYSPEITPYSIIPLKQGNIKRKFKHKGRRYITAKKKGKDQRIGNKEKGNYHFLIAEANTTYIVSSTENSPQDRKYRYNSDSFDIGVDNHASKTISNDSSQFISYITPTPKTILRGSGGN